MKFEDFTKQKEYICTTCENEFMQSVNAGIHIYIPQNWGGEAKIVPFCNIICLMDNLREPHDLIKLFGGGGGEKIYIEDEKEILSMVSDSDVTVAMLYKKDRSDNSHVEEGTATRQH